MVPYEVCGSDVNPGDMARLKVSYAYIHRIHPNTEDNLQYVQDYVNTNKYYLVKRGGVLPFMHSVEITILDRWEDVQNKTKRIIYLFQCTPR